MGGLQHEDVDLPGGGHRPGHVEEGSSRQQGEPEQHQAGRQVQQVFAGVEAAEDSTAGARVGWTPRSGPGSDARAGPARWCGGRGAARRRRPDGPGPTGAPCAGGGGDTGRTGRRCGGPWRRATRPRAGLPMRSARWGASRRRPRLMASSTGHTIRSMPPGIRLIRRPVHGQNRAAQVARVRPEDVGGDAVGGAGARGTEMPGQLQGEPAPHPVRWDSQPLRRERVRRGLGQDLGQSSGQRRGLARRVEMHHSQRPYSEGMTPWATATHPSGADRVGQRTLITVVFCETSW